MVEEVSRDARQVDRPMTTYDARCFLIRDKTRENKVGRLIKENACRVSRSGTSPLPA
ncbi:hypothetical protein [Bifidobacterium asteroides]|uniref:hypothetical protein n=1 Tax=Bifidobacterium asteroides TaxID=1684 RepID=UPI003A80DE7F